MVRRKLNVSLERRHDKILPRALRVTQIAAEGGHIRSSNEE
ncbi:MAG: hypothetical protein ACE5KG_07095 [Nitrososphaerales archaeon]